MKKWFSMRRKRKKRREKLIRPICCKKKSIISNHSLLEKNKIRFITQIFRWFRKDSYYYILSYFLKKKYIISNCDFIDLNIKIQKAGWKKLLLKLNYCMKDYKKLKKRSYSLNFRFFFTNIEDKKNKEITLDIKSSNLDIFNIFITTNAFYFDEFYNIINTLNSRTYQEKDDNDYMLEELNHVYSWSRLNKEICYDAYMPWYITKEIYCTQRQFKKKFEKKYNCIIKEKKLKSIFPLKNIKGHLVVSDKKEKNSKLLYWGTLLKNSNFNRKEDLFKEIRILIKRVNRIKKIKAALVYFFIELLDK